MDTNSCKIYINAPEQTSKSGEILGVWALPTEDVIWKWVYLPNGEKYINGYDIMTKINRKEI